MSENQPTVLLVEDEPLIRLFISERLEDSGVKVAEAANATEALVLMEAGLDIDVLLTDVDMPSGCNSFELAHKVQDSRPEVQILIMSGRQWPSRGDLPMGAAFLAKPCPNEAIVSHVHSAAERAKRFDCSRKHLPAAHGTAMVLPFSKTA